MAFQALGELSKKLDKDLKARLQKAMDADETLKPESAMIQITQEMLKNNPYNPPKGCPVNDLPPELLGHIFRVGVEMEAEGDIVDDEDEWEDEDEGFDLEDGWSSGESDAEDVRMPGGFSARKLGKAKALDDSSMVDLSVQVVSDKPVDGEEEEPAEPVLPFQVLVSHVCKQWRQVAIQSPILWTALEFTEPAPFDKSRIWIERAKESPLDIRINATTDDQESEPFTPGEDDGSTDHPQITPEQHGQVYAEEHSGCRHPPPRMTIQDLNQIFDLITPVVSQWRSLEVSCSIYDYMHVALQRLSQCPGAPILEALELYHYEDTEDYDTFQPKALATKFSILDNHAPKLKDVALWGVHLDWENSISLLSGIQDLELAYHARDVRPSFTTFSQIITQSPQIRTLTLCLSGPAEPDDPADNGWGREALEIPSLQDLVLCYHDCRYAIALVQKLSVPNLRSLALDYDDEDYTDLMRTLIAPAAGKTKSILSGLEHFKIAGLPCEMKTIELMFGQLNGLKTINLNCSTDEVEKIFETLHKSASKSSKTNVYCPNLQMITTTGIDGTQMRSFVEDRRAAGFPVKKVMMSEDDDVDEKDERWLKAHLDDLEYFEPSDSEEEFYEDGVDEDEIMDVDSDDDDGM